MVNLINLMRGEVKIKGEGNVVVVFFIKNVAKRRGGGREGTTR